jgi:hypothetical protein
MKIEKEFLIFKRLLGRNRARPTCIVRARPAAAWPQHRNAWLARMARGLLVRPTSQRGRPGAARGDGGTRTQSSLRGAASGERLQHEPQQGLHREHPRRTANLPDMVESSSSKRGRRTMEGRSSPVRSTAPELNGGEDIT